MNINAYLSFDGRCAAAIKFYEEALGARLLFSQTVGESPMAKDMPPQTHGNIMHATLAIGDGTLMCADSPGGYQKPAGFSLSVHAKDREEGERLFNALAKGGSVQMPFSETFWSPGFGMCTDPFGIPWMVNCEGVPAK